MKLAETADISVGFLCDIENGKKWPTPETIVKLTAALNIEPYQLFMDDTGTDTANEVQIYRRDVSRQLKKSLEQAINDILKSEL
jgi:transcriptional regulator with XRE-family HTH domain